MNGLREKIRNKKGFTLVEMLIVVAIIAILIAVSIPLVGNALDRAKHATDAANERAAKAEILVQYMAGSEAVVDAAKLDTGIAVDTNYYYDASTGGLLLTGTPAGYGQCTTNGGHAATAFLKVRVDANGKVAMEWVTEKNTDAPAANAKLCSTAKDVKHTTP